MTVLDLILIGYFSFSTYIILTTLKDLDTVVEEHSQFVSPTVLKCIAVTVAFFIAPVWYMKGLPERTLKIIRLLRNIMWGDVFENIFVYGLIIFFIVCIVLGITGQIPYK